MRDKPPGFVRVTLSRMVPDGTTPALPCIEWMTVCPRVPAESPSSAELAARLAGCPSIAGMLAAAGHAGEPVLLCVNDSDRATPTREVLRALAALPARGHGSDRPRFRALVATGTHRFTAEARATFERQTFRDCGLPIEHVDWHDSRDVDAHIAMGGFRFDRRLSAHRFLLPIGSVEPHYFAGATGAHKTVTIGCLSQIDIELNHRGALHPASDVFSLAGNPVYDGIVDALGALRRAARRIACVDLVVADGRWLEAATGDPLEALRALLPAVRSVFAHHLEQPVDLLHLRVPPPLGRSLYQADKALKNNYRAVRDGTWIVLEAECELGVGPDAFLALLRDAPDHESALRVVERRGYRLGDHKAVKLRHLTDPRRRGVHVVLASRNVDDADARLCGFERADSAEQALRTVLARGAPAACSGLRVEDAGNVCLTVSP